MQTTEKKQEKRSEMRSLICSEDIWSMGKEVAKYEGVSLSSLIRQTLKRLYAKLHKRKIEVK